MFAQQNPKVSRGHSGPLPSFIFYCTNVILYEDARRNDRAICSSRFIMKFRMDPRRRPSIRSLYDSVWHSLRTPITPMRAVFFPGLFKCHSYCVCLYRAATEPSPNIFFTYMFPILHIMNKDLAIKPSQVL